MRLQALLYWGISASGNLYRSFRELATVANVRFAPLAAIS
jgi:hypothetical protein